MLVHNADLPPSRGRVDGGLNMSESVPMSLDPRSGSDTTCKVSGRPLSRSSLYHEADLVESRQEERDKDPSNPSCFTSAIDQMFESHQNSPTEI